MFRERVYELSKEVMAKNPPSMTGYFDSPGHLKEEMLRTAPDVSLNGQRSSSLWSTFTMSPTQVAAVFRVKDPKGSKEAVGFFSYRINGLLIPGSSGKLVSMRAEPGQELILADAMFQGSRFSNPTIVSMLNTGKPPDSVVAGAQESESAGNTPVDPMKGDVPFQVTPDGSSGIQGSFGAPGVKFTDLDPKTGEEFIVHDPKDAGTPWGTNARTGTTLLGQQDLLHPTVPANTSSGWSFSGGPSFAGDVTKAFIKP